MYIDDFEALDSLLDYATEEGDVGNIGGRLDHSDDYYKYYLAVSGALCVLERLTKYEIDINAFIDRYIARCFCDFNQYIMDRNRGEDVCGMNSSEFSEDEFNLIRNYLADRWRKNRSIKE